MAAEPAIRDYPRQVWPCPKRPQSPAANVLTTSPSSCTGLALLITQRPRYTRSINKAMIPGRNLPAGFFGDRGGIGKEW